MKIREFLLPHSAVIGLLNARMLVRLQPIRILNAMGTLILKESGGIEARY